MKLARIYVDETENNNFMWFTSLLEADVSERARNWNVRSRRRLMEWRTEGASGAETLIEKKSQLSQNKDVLYCIITTFNNDSWKYGGRVCSKKLHNLKGNRINASYGISVSKRN